MDNTKVTIDIGSIGLITFIVFLVLKLCHVIEWSWFWVFFPLWIPYAILLAILIIIGIITFIIELLDR